MEKFSLEIATPPPPSPTTPVIPPFCMNNGTFITTPDGQTVCYCGEFFTGSMCENALCMNGGTPLFESTVCSCPEGYSGSFCEHGNKKHQ